MKKYSQSLAACLFLLLLLSTHFVYGFKNPYWNTKGKVVKIKELQDSTLLVIFHNSKSGYVELSHLRANGDLMATAILSRINQQYDFSILYEYSGEYIVSMSFVEEDSMDTIKYQEFRFYDSSLNLTSALKHVVDTKAKGSAGNDDMNSNLTWAGIIKQGQNSYLKTIQFGQDGVKKHERQNIFSPNNADYFIRKITHHATGNTVFATNQFSLIKFDFDSSFNLVSQDSFPRSYSIDSSGNLYRYDFVMDIIAINDSQFVGIFLDSTDGSKPDSAFIYTTCQSYLVKIQDNKIISSAKIGKQYFWLNLYAAATNGITDYLKLDERKKEIYVLYQYDLDNQYHENVRKVSSNLDSMAGLIWKPSPDIDTVSAIYTFDILQSGMYIIGGSTKSNKGFIGIVDTTGLVSGLQNIDKQREIHLFPNPGKNIVYGIPEHTILRLIDISGRQLNIDQDKNGADISTLNTGIYFYQIIDEQGSIVAKGKYLKE